jgi:hypothetical protein
MINPIRLLVASCFAVALAAPAFAAETKPVSAPPVQHATTKAKAAAPKPGATTKAKAPAPKADSDSLNSQSLQAAKAGQNFAPAASK